MKKITLLALFVLISFLVACGGSTTQSIGTDLTNQDGTVSIEFYGWGSIEESIVFQTLIDTFMVANPDIVVSYTNSSPETYMRVLQNRINNLPDVFYLPDTEFMLWADSGRLLNLDSFISTETLTSIWPEAINRYQYDRNVQVLGSGSLYALPKDLGPFAMVYNKTLFQEIVSAKGLDISLPDPNIPLSWDAFIQLLTQLKYTRQNGQKVFGISHYELPTAVYSNNADFFAASDIRKEGISTPNFVQALQFVANLHLVHGVMPSPNEQVSINGFQRFSTGGTVFSFMGPWDSKGFWENLSFEWDLIPVPYGPAEGSKSTTWVGSMGFAISAKTKKANAAYRLAEFLSISNQSQQLSYQMGQSIPNVISLAKNDYVQGVGLTGMNQQYPANRSMFIKIVEGTDLIGGKARPAYFTYDSIWYNDLMAELIGVFMGSETAAQFANRYKSVLQAALDESYSYIE